MLAFQELTADSKALEGRVNGPLPLCSLSSQGRVLSRQAIAAHFQGDYPGDGTGSTR